MSKRVLVLLSALAIAASIAGAQAAPAPAPAAMAPAPAPGLVWSGTLYIGAETQSINQANPTFNMWDPVNGTPSRFNLQAKYDAGSYGLYLRLREDDTWAQGNNGKVLVRRLYGWMDAANGLVRLQAGRLGDYTWSTGSLGATGLMQVGEIDGPVGVQLQIKPISGLNFGAFLPFMQTSNTTPNFSADTGAGAAATATTIKESNVPANGTPFAAVADAFGNLLVAGSYVQKGLGDVEVGYQFFTASGALPGYTTSGNSFYATPVGSTPGSFPYFFFGAAYTGTPNLYACLESKFVNTNTGSFNYDYFDEEITYNMAPLNFTLWGEQNFWPSSASNNKVPVGQPTAGTQLHFKPIADYTMGIFDLGAFVNFETSSATGSTLMGYSGGPFVKMTTGKGTYTKVTGEFGSGDLLPPPADYPLYLYPGYYTASNQTPQWSSNPNSGFFWQLNWNFVFAF